MPEDCKQNAQLVPTVVSITSSFLVAMLLVLVPCENPTAFRSRGSTIKNFKGPLVYIRNITRDLILNLAENGCIKTAPIPPHPFLAAQHPPPPFMLNAIVSELEKITGKQTVVHHEVVCEV